MLKQLHIRNFAVIDELELQFEAGMTVFTGETGAGKSILIDALGLVLGDRADTSIIRNDTQQTEITAVFQIAENKTLLDLLQEQAIEFEDNELIIRRVVNRDGRSRGYLNSAPVAAQLLRELGEHLIDIHGQHAHQSLIKRDVQRNLLDEYGSYSKQLNEVNKHYQSWHAASSELNTLLGNEKDHSAQMSLLEYQVQELEDLDPQPDEYTRLEEEYKRLENASRLLETAQTSLNTLSEDEHALDSRLNYILQELYSIQKIDPALKTATELLDGAVIQVNEATEELRHYLDKVELQPERLAEVEKRLNDLNDVARKHHIQTQELPNHLQELSEQLHNLLNNQKRFADLEKQQTQALADYSKAAGELHESRNKAATKMAKEISKQLKTLGMPDGKFEIEIQKQSDQKPQAYGNDQIEFLVSANAGQPPQSLRKVASGGELSRISLAIQVIASHDKGIPTLVFDEVDSGIGGGVAEIVGKLLHGLAEHRQVFCVTHLAQVASQADQHLQVEKSSNKKTTQTQVVTLNESDRIEEIARMLGGINISKQSLEHAKEMLNVH